MAMHLEDTIAAIATAPGGAARGIVRLSGPRVAECLRMCRFAALDAALLETRSTIVLRAGLPLAPLALAPLPCDIYLWPGQRSYTREPVAEIHTLGSPPLVAAVLKHVCAAGARPAQPGEFTLRAFLAGRIDLTQAEAVLGVIDARGDGELESALAQLAGGLATPLHGLRARLLDLLAHLEAGLDFVEEDIEFISPAELAAELDAARGEIARALAQMDARGEVCDALRVALVGRPNAGKSSLFNALLAATRRDTRQDSASPGPLASPAIVSSEPGATRDYLSAPLELAGTSIELVDTAGVDQAWPSDALAQAAQEQSLAQHATAQLRLVCIDASVTLSDWDRQQIEFVRANAATRGVADASAPRESTYLIWTKCDAPRAGKIEPSAIGELEFHVSSHTGAGLEPLLAALAKFAGAEPSRALAPVAATVARCRESLRRAERALAEALGLSRQRGQEELVAWEIRSALDALGEVVGTIYTDDVLDRVFSRFCIGK